MAEEDPNTVARVLASRDHSRAERDARGGSRRPERVPLRTVPGLWRDDRAPYEVAQAKLRLCEALAGAGATDSVEFVELMELVEEYVAERLLWGE